MRNVIIAVLWRHPDTGREHELEFGLIWRDSYLFDSVRANLKDIGELPVRVDPDAPEKFPTVDVSAVR